jgi:hypothetical protein
MAIPAGTYTIAGGGGAEGDSATQAGGGGTRGGGGSSATQAGGGGTRGGGGSSATQAGGGGGGGGDPLASNSGEQPKQVVISAYCLDSNRPGPTSDSVFKNVFASPEAVSVTVAGREYSLQEAIDQQLIRINGAPGLDLAVTNLTNDEVTIEVGQNVVLGEEGDTPYGLPIEAIQSVDFSSLSEGGFDIQGALWDRIIPLLQLQALGYDVNLDDEPFGSQNAAAQESFKEDWGFYQRPSAILYERDRIAKVNGDNPTIRLVSVRLVMGEDGRNEYLVFGDSGRPIYRGRSVRGMFRALHESGVADDIEAVYFSLDGFPDDKAAAFSASLENASLGFPNSGYVVQPFPLGAILPGGDESADFQAGLFSKGVRLLRLSTGFTKAETNI